jgi:hypothetical protein
MNIIFTALVTKLFNATYASLLAMVSSSVHDLFVKVNDPFITFGGTSNEILCNEKHKLHLYHTVYMRVISKIYGVIPVNNHTPQCREYSNAASIVRTNYLSLTTKTSVKIFIVRVFRWNLVLISRNLEMFTIL